MFIKLTLEYVDAINSGGMKTFYINKVIIYKYLQYLRDEWIAVENQATVWGWGFKWGLPSYSIICK